MAPKNITKTPNDPTTTKSAQNANKFVYLSILCIGTNQENKFVGTVQISPKTTKKNRPLRGAGTLWCFISLQENMSKVMVILEEIAIFLDLLPLFF